MEVSALTVLAKTAETFLPTSNLNLHSIDDIHVGCSELRQAKNTILQKTNMHKYLIKNKSSVNLLQEENGL